MDTLLMRAILRDFETNALEFFATPADARNAQRTDPKWTSRSCIYFTEQEVEKRVDEAVKIIRADVKRSEKRQQDADSRHTEELKQQQEARIRQEVDEALKLTGAIFDHIARVKKAGYSLDIVPLAFGMAENIIKANQPK